MDHFVKGALKMGLLDAQDQREEITQFLAMVQRLAELFSKESNMKQIGRDVVRVIIEETNFENCSILLWNAEEKDLALLAAFGLEDLLGEETSRWHNSKLSFAQGEAIAGQVFSTRSPVFIEDSSEHRIPLKKEAAVVPVSLACLPLLDLGVLNLSSNHPHSFSHQQKRNWELLGKLIAHILLQSSAHSQSKSTPRSPLLSEPENGKPHTNSDVGLNDRVSEQVIDRTPQGICLLDVEGNLVRINESIRKLQGVDASVLKGRSPSVFFHDPSVFDKLFERARDHDPVEMSDVTLVNSEGRLYLADIHLGRLTDYAGETTGYLMVVNDMTQKKAFAEKMLQTEKLAALGTMAGGVAHDFNNLLMAILGNIQMILQQSTDEETKRRLLNIEKAVQDGAHTVRRLQKFNERERELRPGVQPVDVSEAVKDVVELTRPRWKNGMEKFGHTIQFEMEVEQECFASIHASDLREVLTNLIFNAIEAMPEGGRLTLKSRCLKKWAIVEISDTGIGMSEEVTRRIFDPFYTTKGVGNSGLGLSVSWSLVSRAGGEIQVKSRPGRGTTFIVKLPRGESPQIIANDTIQEEMTNICRLLVVDDDPEVLEILRDMLRLNGHTVVATDDGEEALKLIEDEHFDLVLTDLGMPDVSGWDIAKKAKARDSTVPVVLITGWGAQYEEEDLSKNGIDLVLSKPLSWQRLLGSVDKLLMASKTCRVH